MFYSTTFTAYFGKFPVFSHNRKVSLVKDTYLLLDNSLDDRENFLFLEISNLAVDSLNILQFERYEQWKSKKNVQV